MPSGHHSPPVPSLQLTAVVEEQPHIDEDPSNAGEFHGRLEDLLAEVTTTLPKALLPTPPKLSPAAVRAIHDLVMVGGGKNLLKEVNAATPSTSADRIPGA
ncbi:hypothetical protein GUJ93_ZPchr0011g28658 [Zizania palustris]|uniref:Uncharacterized protein n=1 Tax=Zizania palustris TaxID=103762 RepID=A0A8J6BP89_ZIZPA|nr:hypothetical protein GUJ93_ZPchr0011g28658 [Zizania palustris]